VADGIVTSEQAFTMTGAEIRKLRREVLALDQ
jgi:hypothetical protein